MKYLLVADTPKKIQPEFDTSLRLTSEALRRGIEVDYCDLTQVDAARPTDEYLRRLPVQSVLTAKPVEDVFLELGPQRVAAVEDYAVILQRKDPPVDDFFRAHSAHFARAPKWILQINNPEFTAKLSEHALPMDYPQFSIPTEICRSEREFVRSVRARKGETVAKPENECSGKGVQFFAADAPEADLRAYWNEWRPEIVVQPFVDEITKSGDLRVLVMNGKIMGSVMRVAKAGSRLANLHQGASWRGHTLTPKQIEAAHVIGRDLAEKGLYLLGLDFIGERISEVNITSPSAMVQINEVMAQRTEVMILNEIESLRFLRERAFATI